MKRGRGHIPCVKRTRDETDYACTNLTRKRIYRAAKRAEKQKEKLDIAREQDEV